MWRALSTGHVLSLGLLAGCEREAARGGSAGASQVTEVTKRLSPAPAPPRSDPEPVRAEESEARVDGAEDAGAPTRRTSGAPSPTCVAGWMSPPRGSELRKAALDMMRSAPGERFVVDEIRYFVGPEDAEVIGPPRRVERWYVKAHTLGKPGRRLRWLVRRASVGSGVDAVAPYDSTGYGPGVWTRVDATDPSLADPFLFPCDRARPGDNCMGLPRDVLGCLDGT